MEKCEKSDHTKSIISYCIPEPEVQVAAPSVHVPLLPLTPLLAIAPRSK
jgi:hypothetical protein